MRNIFTVILLMFFAFLGSAKAQLNPVGVTPNVTMGGITIPLSQAVILSGYSASSTNYATVYRNGVAYQVPVGKKLVIIAVSGGTYSATNSSISVGYGDNAVESTVAPTNAVTFDFGAANEMSPTAGASTMNSGVPTYLEVPAGKYPFIRSSQTVAGGLLVQLLCMLVNV